MGQTIDFLSIWGIFPFSTDILNIWVSGSLIFSIVFFNRIAGKKSGPHEVFVLILEAAHTISSSSKQKSDNSLSVSCLGFGICLSVNGVLNTLEYCS